MKRDNAHDPRAIANKILEICESEGRSITIMQLIKLTYLADGWSMALRGKPLSSLDPQAWQHGPVFPTVYKAFNRFGSGKITEPAKVPGTDVPISDDFTEDELALIRQVVSSYGKYHAFRLSEIMHRVGTPWSDTIEAKGKYADIPLEVMAKHFAELRDQRKIRASA